MFNVIICNQLADFLVPKQTLPVANNEINTYTYNYVNLHQFSTCLCAKNLVWGRDYDYSSSEPHF